MPDFTGSLIVVTGGANGIGLATARDLASLGASVVIVDLDGDRLDRARVEIAGKGPVHGFALDVSDRDAVFALAERIEAEIGAVSGLVTCAGITSPAPSESMNAEAWRKVLAVNLDGTFFSCQAFGAFMLARRRGAIVTISSSLGLSAQSGRVNYVASKWGVIGVTKTLAIEWADRGVRVNCVAPGPVSTALFEKLPAELRKTVYARTPMGRAAATDELARAAAFLLSGDASFITGTTLPVDGGYTCGHATDGGSDARSEAREIEQ